MIFIEYLSICYIECLIFQQNLDAMPLRVKWLKGQRVPFFLEPQLFIVIQYCAPSVKGCHGADTQQLALITH